MVIFFLKIIYRNSNEKMKMMKKLVFETMIIFIYICLLYMLY